MDWLDIKGHDEHIKSLQAMLATGRMPHALLFAGPAGIGKSTLAAVTAKGLLCLAVSQQPCRTCQACRLVEQGGHPDLLRIQPDGSSIKIDQIRSLKQEAAKAPHFSENRVCIIEDAGKMTLQAQNSLLKLLEEPPEGFVFILTTDSLRSLLITILSRCRIMRFNPLCVADLTELLTSRGIDLANAVVAAHLSGGRIGEALSLSAEGGLHVRDAAFHIICELPQQHQAILWENGVFSDKMSSVEVKALLTYFLYIFRDLYLLHQQQPKLMLNVDLEEKLATQTVYWDEHACLAAMDLLRETEKALSANANVRLTGEALLLNLINLLQGRKNFANCSRGAL